MKKEHLTYGGLVNHALDTPVPEEERFDLLVLAAGEGLAPRSAARLADGANPFCPPPDTPEKTAKAIALCAEMAVDQIPMVIGAWAACPEALSLLCAQFFTHTGKMINSSTGNCAVSKSAADTRSPYLCTPTCGCGTRVTTVMANLPVKEVPVDAKSKDLAEAAAARKKAGPPDGLDKAAKKAWIAKAKADADKAADDVEKKGLSKWAMSLLTACPFPDGAMLSLLADGHPATVAGLVFAGCREDDIAVWRRCCLEALSRPVGTEPDGIVPQLLLPVGDDDYVAVSPMPSVSMIDAVRVMVHDMAPRGRFVQNGTVAVGGSKPQNVGCHANSMVGQVVTLEHGDVFSRQDKARGMIVGYGTLVSNVKKDSVKLMKELASLPDGMPSAVKDKVIFGKMAAYLDENLFPLETMLGDSRILSEVASRDDLAGELARVACGMESAAPDLFDRIGRHVFSSLVTTAVTPTSRMEAVGSRCAATLVERRMKRVGRLS